MYEKEYINSVDKNSFVKKLLNKKITKPTAIRAFYRLRSQLLHNIKPVKKPIKKVVKKPIKKVVKKPIKKVVKKPIIIDNRYLREKHDNKISYLMELTNKEDKLKITEKNNNKNILIDLGTSKIKKIEQPNSIKMLQLMQLKEKDFEITEEYLIRNNFSKGEIQWLKKMKKI